MKTIEAFNTNQGAFPWRVTVDGKPDPRNRDFESMMDVRKTYAILQAAGFYKDYTISKRYDDVH